MEENTLGNTTTNSSNHEFKGTTKEAIRDIREDIKEIKTMLRDQSDRFLADMQGFRDRCEGYRESVYKSRNALAENLSAISTQVHEIKKNKSNITKIRVAVITGISSIVGAVLGVAPFFILW